MREQIDMGGKKQPFSMNKSSQFMAECTDHIVSMWCLELVSNVDVDTRQKFKLFDL